MFGSACSIAYNRCSDLPLWEPLARSPPWREGGIRPWREGAWGESSKCWRGNAAPGLLSVVRVREGDVSDRGACQVTLVEGLRKTRVSRAAAGVSLSQKLLINCRRVPAFAGRGRLLLRSVIGQEYSLCDERQRGRQTRMSNAKPMRILQTRVLAGFFRIRATGRRGDARVWLLGVVIRTVAQAAAIPALNACVCVYVFLCVGGYGGADETPPAPACAHTQMHARTHAHTHTHTHTHRLVLEASYEAVLYAAALAAHR